MERHNVSLGGPYEEIVGLSRAVRVGPFVSVGGTAPIGEDGKTEGVGDPSAQARRCYEIVGQALACAGASFADVVRTRHLLTRIEDVQAVVEVRKEFVGDARPVDTFVEVSRFIDPDWLVEVEVDAIIAE